MCIVSIYLCVYTYIHHKVKTVPYISIFRLILMIFFSLEICFRLLHFFVFRDRAPLCHSPGWLSCNLLCRPTDLELTDAPECGDERCAPPCLLLPWEFVCPSRGLHHDVVRSIVFLGISVFDLCDVCFLPYDTEFFFSTFYSISYHREISAFPFVTFRLFPCDM